MNQKQLPAQWLKLKRADITKISSQKELFRKFFTGLQLNFWKLLELQEDLSSKEGIANQADLINPERLESNFKNYFSLVQDLFHQIKNISSELHRSNMLVGRLEGVWEVADLKNRYILNFYFSPYAENGAELPRKKVINMPLGQILDEVFNYQGFNGYLEVMGTLIYLQKDLKSELLRLYDFFELMKNGEIILSDPESAPRLEELENRLSLAEKKLIAGIKKLKNWCDQKKRFKSLRHPSNCPWKPFSREHRYEYFFKNFNKKKGKNIKLLQGEVAVYKEGNLSLKSNDDINDSLIWPLDYPDYSWACDNKFAQSQIPIPNLKELTEFGRTDLELMESKDYSEVSEFELRQSPEEWDLEYAFKVFAINLEQLKELSQVKKKWIIRQKFKLMISQYHPDRASKQNKDHYDLMSRIIIASRKNLEQFIEN